VSIHPSPARDRLDRVRTLIGCHSEFKLSVSATVRALPYEILKNEKSDVDLCRCDRHLVLSLEQGKGESRMTFKYCRTLDFLPVTRI